MIEPRVVEWRITGICNERCVYCYGPEKDVNPKTSIVEKIATTLAVSPVETIRFSGGEPLLVPNFRNVLETLKSHGKKVVLSTNGVTLKRDRVWLDSLVDKLNLSIDGATPEAHSINGRKEMGFALASAALVKFAELPARYPIKIGTVYTSRNFASKNHLLDMYEMLAQYPLAEWKIYQYIPEGPIVDLDLKITDQQFAETEEAFRRAVPNPKFDIIFASATTRLAAYFIVQPEGEVIIPVWDSANVAADEVTCGNILVDSFGDISKTWASHAVIDNHLANYYFYRNS